jgi:cytochrome P450
MNVQPRKIKLFASLRYLRAFQKDPILLMDQLHQEYGDWVELSVGFKKILFCFHPFQAGAILRTNSNAYRKSRLIFDKIVPLTGARGLVQLEGKDGRDHRQITGASLSTDALQAIYPLWVKAIQSELDSIAEKTGQEIDLASVLTRIVLRNAMILVFGKDFGGESCKLAELFLKANQLCGSRIRNLLSAPYRVPTAKNLRLRRTIRAMDELIYELIDERLLSHENSKGGKDLLSVLVEKRLSRSQIRDHLVTFLFAGHETTASSLAWTFYLLSRHPFEERCLQEELQSHFAGKTPEFAELRKLSFTLNTYQEALRLFPPSWTLAREAIQKDQIAGYDVAPGTLVLIGVGQIHRRSDFWEEPQKFIPKRFETDLSSVDAFIPFGGGSRICIGMRTALVEAALVLSMTVQRLKFEFGKGFQPDVEAMITAHPRGGMPVQVKKGESYVNCHQSA